MSDQTEIHSEMKMSDRKSHHLELAEKSQLDSARLNSLFDYEPLMSGFPEKDLMESPIKIGKKMVKQPLWISSMTGGTGEAGAINKALAKIAGEFGLGMGLGSCRPLLESDKYFDDFNLRPLIGEEGVLFANFGLAQVFEELSKDNGLRLLGICERLQVDGVFLHINPLQEWYQPEGDRWTESPLVAIEKLGELLKSKGILLGVKEVGQGMGPRSLEALIEGPADLIEFGAFGGTNFSLLERLRGPDKDHASEERNPVKSITFQPYSKTKEFCFVGHSAKEMVSHVNRIIGENKALKDQKTFIVSGGIRSFLEGHYLVENLEGRGLYAMAKPFLEAAQLGEDSLRSFVQSELEGLTLAKTFLRAKPLGGPGGDQ
jgi:isopentenyl-diphosphate delta-isomerase